MPNVKSGVKYGAQGAAIGTAIAPGIGTLIGGGLGFLGGLFGGGDEEEENRKRYEEFLRVLSTERKKRAEEVSKQTSGLLQQATAAGGQRARAAGRAEDAEDYIIAAQGPILRAGREATAAAVAPYDQARIGAAESFASRPIQPSTLDYLSEAGGSVADYLNYDRYLKALGQSEYAPTIGGAGTPVPDAMPSGTEPNLFGLPGRDFGSSVRKAHRRRDINYSPLYDDDYLGSYLG